MRRAIVLFPLLLCAAAASAPRREAPGELTDAIAALRQEAENALNGIGDLRRECDFFSEPPGDVTPEQVFALLRSKQHARVEIDCYIRWQMLSALPKRVAAAETAQLLSLLRSAPRLPQRPGLDATTQGRLAAELQSARFDQLDAANQRVAGFYADYQRGLVNLVRYRDALLRRCQPTRNAIAAAVEEFQARVKLGIEVTESCRSTLFPLVRDFAVSEGRPEDLSRIADAIRNLCYAPAPRWVLRLKWDNPTGDREIIWGSSALNDGDANDMVAELKNLAAAGVQSGKLKLKD